MLFHILVKYIFFVKKSLGPNFHMLIKLKLKLHLALNLLNLLYIMGLFVCSIVYIL